MGSVMVSDTVRAINEAYDIMAKQIEWYKLEESRYPDPIPWHMRVDMATWVRLLDLKRWADEQV